MLFTIIAVLFLTGAILYCMLDLIETENARKRRAKRRGPKVGPL